MSAQGGVPMRIFDVHSHWGTKRGYPLRTEAELAKQDYTWRSAPVYATEDEMVAEFRRNRVRVILDLGFTKDLPVDEAREFNDYAIDTQKRYADTIFGNWITLHPTTGKAGVAEFRRCIEASPGFIGLSVPAASLGFPACDPVFDPFYDVCLEYGRPVMVTVGYTGRGAGLPGGGGIRLELCHPRYVDELAVRFPGLTIIAGRPAWPWQDEMIAVLLHKPNVWNELHGWSPKHYTDALKREIPRRLKHKIMFGADYPLLRYERLVKDWHDLGYDPETLAKVFHENAEALFGVQQA